MSEQMTLSLEPGLLMHPDLKSCIAAGIYQRGLNSMAGKLDLSPSHLSEALSRQDHRKFDVADLERYIQQTGDKSPILYLVAKYMRDASAVQADALERLVTIAESLPGLIAQAGLQPMRKGRK